MRIVVATAAAAVVTFMAIVNPGSYVEASLRKGFVDVDTGAQASGVDIEAHRALATTGNESISLCLNGYPGIQTDDVCCALECGECGGVGCSSRPGGDASCCTSTIKNDGSSCSEVDAAPCHIDDLCENGYSGIQAGDVCCALECGDCGGSGCGSRPGGKDSCCTSIIKESGSSCSEVDAAPCFFEEMEPTPSPTPSPIMPPTPSPTMSTCSNGFYGYQSGTVCCDVQCGACGGFGCRFLPGGPDHCCASRILDAGISCEDTGEAPCLLPEPTPMPTAAPTMMPTAVPTMVPITPAPTMPPTPAPTMSTCSNGFYGYQSGNACCDVQCGACGGAGCRFRPGGPDHCCTSRILDAGILCEDTGEAPCLLPEPTPSPTPNPTMPPTPAPTMAPTTPAPTTPPTHTPTMSTCSNGFYGYQLGDICCDIQCGACGGAGCRFRPGGPDHCCTSRILENGISCADVAEAPCIIPE